MYQTGDTAYIIESNRTIRKGFIVRKNGDMYLFSYIGGGGLWVRKNRLYKTENEAKAAIPHRATASGRLRDTEAFRQHLSAISG